MQQVRLSVSFFEFFQHGFEGEVCERCEQCNDKKHTVINWNYGNSTKMIGRLLRLSCCSWVGCPSLLPGNVVVYILGIMSMCT